MFKKGIIISKQQKIDIDTEPKLIHKINPCSHESKKQDVQGNDSNSNPDQEFKAYQQKSKGRSSIHEIVGILQRPMMFQIVENNNQKGSSVEDSKNISTTKEYGKNSSSSSGNPQQIQQQLENQLSDDVGISIAININQLHSSIASTVKNQSQQSNIIVIAENNIPSYIEKCIELGLNYLNQNMIKEAVYQLRSAEVLIDKYLAQDGQVSTELMLGVVMNLGICFYKASLFDEAYSCFENCDLRIKGDLLGINGQALDSDAEEGENTDIDQQRQILGLISQGKMGDQLKKIRLRLQLNFQMCILFSEVGKHEDSLDYAKKSAKLSINLILDSLSASYGMLISAYLPSQQLTAQQITKLISKVLTTLNALEDTRKPGYYRKRARSEYGNFQEIPPNGLAGQDNKGTESPSPSVIKKPRSASTKITEKIGVHVNHIESISMGLRDILQKGQNKTLTDEDIELGLKTIPVLNYVSSVFASLKGKLTQGLEEKYRLNESLRILLEQLMIVNVSQNRAANNNGKTCSNLRGILSVSSQQLDMEFITSTVKNQHWLLTSNILNLLQLKPIPLIDIAGKIPVIMEMQPEDTLRKIVDTAISFYCISTETRFVEESSFLQPSLLSFKLSDSELWLGKSLEIAYALIPQDAPMISQIINVFTRFHGVEKQIIPEVEEIVEQVKLLKPQKGVNITSSAVSALKNNFFIPAIRTTIPKTQRTSQDISNSSNQQECHDNSDMREESSQRLRIQTPNNQENSVQQDMLEMSSEHQLASNGNTLIPTVIYCANTQLNSDVEPQNPSMEKQSQKQQLSLTKTNNFERKKSQDKELKDQIHKEKEKIQEIKAMEFGVDLPVKVTQQSQEHQIQSEEYQQFLVQKQHSSEGIIQVNPDKSSPPRKQLVFDKIQALVNKQRPQSSKNEKDSKQKETQFQKKKNQDDGKVESSKSKGKIGGNGNEELSDGNKHEKARLFNLINNKATNNQMPTQANNINKRCENEVLCAPNQSFHTRITRSQIAKENMDTQVHETKEHCFTEPDSQKPINIHKNTNNIDIFLNSRVAKADSSMNQTQQRTKNKVSSTITTGQVVAKLQQYHNSNNNNHNQLLSSSTPLNSSTENENNFLKSFNQFLKLNTKVPDNGHNHQKGNQQNGQPQESMLLSKETTNTNPNIPLWNKHKRKTQQSFFDHHRISLPDSFASANQITKQLNSSNSTSTSNQQQNLLKTLVTECSNSNNPYNEIFHNSMRTTQKHGNTTTNTPMLSTIPSRRSSESQTFSNSKDNRCGSQEKERTKVVKRAFSGNRQTCMMMTINTNMNEINNSSSNAINVVETKEQGIKHMLEIDVLSRSSCKNKRTHSASNPKTGCSSTSAKSAASTQPFTSPSSTIQSDAVPLKNNFITNSSKTQQQQPLPQPQLQSFTVQLPQKKQNQQMQVQQCFEQDTRMNLANQFSQQQQSLQQAQLNILTALQQNSAMSNQIQRNNGNNCNISNPIDLNSRNNYSKIKQVYKRKHSGNASTHSNTVNNASIIASTPGNSTTSGATPWMFNDKIFALATLKSPTNNPPPSSSTTINTDNINNLPQSTSQVYSSPTNFSTTATNKSKLHSFLKQQQSFTAKGMIVLNPSYPQSAQSGPQQAALVVDSRQKRMKTEHGDNFQPPRNLQLFQNEAANVNLNRTLRSAERPKTTQIYSRLKTLM